MPWGLVAAGVGVVGSKLAADKASKTTGKVIDAEQQATREATALQEGYYQQGKAALQPYANQEQAASTQLMQQMGLAPPGGAYGGGGGGGYATPSMGTGGGDAWGFGAEPAGGSPESRANMDNLIADMLTQQQVIFKRAGYNGTNIHREAAQRTSELLNQMKQSGQLPASFQMPATADLTAQASDIEKSYGGHTKMAKNLFPGLTSDTFSLEESVGGLLSKYDIRPPTGGVNAGIMGPGQMAPGQKIPPNAMIGGETPSSGYGGGGPQTISDIMRRAGAEQLPGGFSESYFEDIQADPRNDPELAGYLGLTDESLQVGNDYQQTGAYQAARDQGIEAVNAGAAGSGSLYSGSRGKALRDVGQDVEQKYYQDAMNRRADMMGARRGERTSNLNRRGTEYGNAQNRGQSYYNNYMQILTDLSSPTTTTNIAQMGTDIGKEASSNLLDSTRNVGNLQIGRSNVQGQAIQDVAGGLGKLATSYI